MIEEALKRGARLDGWDEHFSYQTWLDAFAACGVDPDFYTVRGYAEDEVLPWDTMDVGVTKKFLLRERKRAYDEKITPDCRQGCAGCGARKQGSGCAVGRWLDCFLKRPAMRSGFLIWI